MTASTHSYETIRVDRPADHVAELVLNRPAKGNALNPLLFREFGAAIAALDAEADVRAIVVRGEGKAFSYGLDLSEAMGELGAQLQGGLAGPRRQLREHIRELQRLTGAPAAARKPVVAAIPGWCIGGGVDIISACDLRFAAADAKFSVREARIGIVADIGSLQRLPRIIGDAATRELALTAKDVDAERALKLGLVSDVLPTPEAALARARQEAALIAGLPPLTVQGVKHILNAQDGKTVDEGLEYVATWNAAFLQSEDFAEAIAAFFAKRPPLYKGA